MHADLGTELCPQISISLVLFHFTKIDRVSELLHI